MATIVDFDDLKTMLGLTKDSFLDYPDLELIADEVHSDLESYVGRKLDVISKKTETGFTIGKEKYINITNLPITSVESVSIDGEDLTSDDYIINDYGLSFTKKIEGKWIIVTKGGFKSIPDDIYKGELSQIVYEYQNKNNLAATNFTNDGGSVQLPGFTILKHVKELLNPYYHIDKLGY